MQEMSQQNSEKIGSGKSLVIGYGEIGKALTKILREHYRVDTWDINSGIEPLGNYDIMHICFPYSNKFIDYVKAYQAKYEPKFTVIHSTVPLGTSRECNAIHSPIRGLHPNLESGIRTFVKFLGGEQSSEVADYFRRAGLRVCLFDRQENSEALKLWDTTQYLESVRMTKRIKKYCIKHNLSFSDIYRIGNLTYNQGYQELGHPEYTRPVLEPIMTEIGGHCLTPNEELLKLSE